MKGKAGPTLARLKMFQPLREPSIARASGYRMTRRRLATGRIRAYSAVGVTAAAWTFGSTTFDQRIHLSGIRRVSRCFIRLKRPGFLRAVNLFKIIDAGRFLGVFTRFHKAGDGDGGQEADDGHNDHDFDERER